MPQCIREKLPLEVWCQVIVFGGHQEAFSAGGHGADVVL